MKFRTELELTPAFNKIEIADPILTTGSCFADTIGKKLEANKFNVQVNPTGTTYNPHSIHTQLLTALHNSKIPENSYLEHDQIHLNYNYHSTVSGHSRSALVKTLHELNANLHLAMKNTRWLMITYGTAWVYRHTDTGEIVANCHKKTGTLFTKELLTQKKVLDSFDEVYQEAKNINKDLQIILTVSPVRHIKDTLSLNAVSKSVLRVACDTITQQYKDVNYFPAFEIMIDDLRDYRFYKSDLIHPTEDAEEYIWDKFTSCYFDKDSLAFLEKWKPIQSALQHRAFHPSSASHQSFLKNLLLQLESIKNQVNVVEEINWVQSQLH